jgi:hypothetical protein
MSDDGYYNELAKRFTTDKRYTQSDGILPVRAVVMHIADGFNADGWLMRQDVNASAHFVVKQTGKISQLVSIYDRAWANGLGWSKRRHLWISPAGNYIKPPWPGLIPGKDPNLYTISIEEEGYPSTNRPPAQRQATIKLVAWLGIKLGLRYIVHETLIGHNEINNDTRKNCPGPYADLGLLAGAANRLIDEFINANPPPSNSTQVRQYLVVKGPANVRKSAASGRGVPIKYQFQVGTRVDVIGDPVDGQEVSQGGVTSNKWAKVSDGYIWLPLLSPLN